jgi:hypothetical protein
MGSILYSDYNKEEEEQRLGQNEIAEEFEGIVLPAS